MHEIEYISPVEYTPPPPRGRRRPPPRGQLSTSSAHCQRIMFLFCGRLGMAIYTRHREGVKLSASRCSQCPAPQRYPLPPTPLPSPPPPSSLLYLFPVPNRYRNDEGREESMEFKLERDMHSIQKAMRLGLEIDPSAMSVDIPVFFAEGLEVGHFS